MPTSQTPTTTPAKTRAAKTPTKKTPAKTPAAKTPAKPVEEEVLAEAPAEVEVEEPVVEEKKTVKTPAKTPAKKTPATTPAAKSAVKKAEPEPAVEEDTMEVEAEAEVQKAQPVKKDVPVVSAFAKKRGAPEPEENKAKQVKVEVKTTATGEKIKIGDVIKCTISEMPSNDVSNSFWVVKFHDLVGYLPIHAVPFLVGANPREQFEKGQIVTGKITDFVVPNPTTRISFVLAVIEPSTVKYSIKKNKVFLGVRNADSGVDLHGYYPIEEYKVEDKLNTLPLNEAVALKVDYIATKSKPKSVHLVRLY